MWGCVLAQWAPRQIYWLIVCVMICSSVGYAYDIYSAENNSAYLGHRSDSILVLNHLRVNVTCSIGRSHASHLKSSPPGQNGRHFADEIFKSHYLKKCCASSLTYIYGTRGIWVNLKLKTWAPTGTWSTWHSTWECQRVLTLWFNGPLTRYAKLWFGHAPGMLGTFSPPPGLPIPTCIMARAVMHAWIAN